MCVSASKTPLRDEVSDAYEPGRERIQIPDHAVGIDPVTVVETMSVNGTLYDTLYCARGWAENLIKLHKSQLASDRTSCRSALANQERLVLHTAAYWLMLTVRAAIPKPHPLATAEFTTLQMRLLKIAGRITEAATRVRIAFAAACRTVAHGAIAPHSPRSHQP